MTKDELEALPFGEYFVLNTKTGRKGLFQHYSQAPQVVIYPEDRTIDFRDIKIVEIAEFAKKQSKGNSDLSDVKMGDFIATAFDGWVEVDKVFPGIYVVYANGRSYTINGFSKEKDVYPTAWIEPPSWLLEKIGPRPEKKNKKAELIDSLLSTIRVELEKQPDSLTEVIANLVIEHKSKKDMT